MGGLTQAGRDKGEALPMPAAGVTPVGRARRKRFSHLIVHYPPINRPYGHGHGLARRHLRDVLPLLSGGRPRGPHGSCGLLHRALAVAAAVGAGPGVGVLLHQVRARARGAHALILSGLLRLSLFLFDVSSRWVALCFVSIAFSLTH